MLHALTFSIINHLKTQVKELTDVVWIYDGVDLTGREKPFSVVEQMPEASTLLASGREDYEETYRFQVGLYARSISERTKLSESVKNALRQPKITLLDTSVIPPTISGVFICDVTAVTPIPIDELANETNKHRVYLDVEVSIYRANGQSEFTQ